MVIMLSLTYVSIDNDRSHSKYYFRDQQTKVASTIYLLGKIGSNNYDSITIFFYTFSSIAKCLQSDRTSIILSIRILHSIESIIVACTLSFWKDQISGHAVFNQIVFEEIYSTICYS